MMASLETQPCRASTADKVCAIVVSYFPEIGALRRLFFATLPQVDALVVVENGTSDAALDGFCAQTQCDKIVILKQDRNIGLAAAFNRGISWARQHGFSHVLLLDQDSEPTQGMVRALMQGLVASSTG